MPIANAMCSIKDQMVLGDNAIKSFRIAKQASDYSDRINAIDFSPNGEHLISGEVSDQIIIYDCDSNKLIRTIPVRKYGVDLIRYTRSTDKFLHTSTKRDHTIRHMISFEHENKYLYYYDGHTERVVSLSVSPTDELFLSASLDRTVRLWDLRSNYCKGIMHLSDRPVVAFDPTGVVFAAGINSECFKLYDIRMFDKGPFVTFKLDAKTEKCFKWIDLKFSDDGKTIMVNTNGSTIRLIDAFNGKILQTINDRTISAEYEFESCFSPDSQYILSGSLDGLLHIWNVNTGAKVCALQTDKNEPIRWVRFNPKLMMLATADKAVNFWMPTI